MAAAPQMQITYCNLQYSVKQKTQGAGLWNKSFECKDILKSITGTILPMRLTAVMGASGAGKTTMLNVLAGHSPNTAIVKGEILVNGAPVIPKTMKRISAFVHQEDVILDTMTVREALTFSAMLRLPASTPTATKVERALEVAEILGLTASLGSLVGSSMVKGISGGEKRRLSVGMEMITNPSILFLDEPTSGLDTFNAYRVVRVLQQLAHKYNRTVVATVHQPSSDIFAMFDDLVVLAMGEVLFHSTATSMVPYFDRLGYVCPTYTNPADFLFMDVLNAGSKDEQEGGMVPGLPVTTISVTSASSVENGRVPALPPATVISVASASSPESQGKAGPTAEPGKADPMDEMEGQTKGSPLDLEQLRIRALLDSWTQSAEGQQMQRAVDDTRKRAGQGIDQAAVLSVPPFLLQYSLLAQRSWANSWRNKLIMKGKLARTLFLSILVGLIFLQIGNDQKGVQDRQGALFFLSVQGLFGSVMGVMMVFGTEKAVFQREYGGRMYGLPAYFLSRTMVDLPARILLPIISAAITYWMIGFQADGAKFCWYMLIFILLDNAGAGLGVLVGCIFNDLAVAMSVLPLFMLPLMIFSGFIVNVNSIGGWFVWISYISPIRYAFTAIALNEFGGLRIDCKPGQDCPDNYDGDAVIRQLGFADKGGVVFQAGMLVVLIVSFLTVAYCALARAVRRSST